MKEKLLICVFLFSFTGIFGQDGSEGKSAQKFPIVLAFSAHSYSWPFVKSIVTPIQPGFKIGTEYVYSSKGNRTLLQTLSIGYFKNPDFLKAYYLNSHFTYRYTFANKIFIDASIGLGYIHRRHSREVFVLNDKGEYENKFDWGSPGIQGGFSLGTGYNFKVKEKQLSVFLNYEWFVNYPESNPEIPIMAHSLYHIGIRYYLKK